MSSVGGQDKPNGWRILIVGTGGQGVLTAARLLCDCFVELGHDVVSGQLHGMAQRGGAVQASVIIDGGICPVIPSGRADVVLGFEPVETVRAMPFVSSDTLVITNTTPVLPFVLAQQAVGKNGGGQYPDVDQLVAAVRSVASRVFALDVARLAQEAGSVKALNMVMLGAMLGSSDLPCSPDAFRQAVDQRMPASLREVNTKAFFSGVETVSEAQRCGEAS